MVGYGLGNCTALLARNPVAYLLTVLVRFISKQNVDRTHNADWHGSTPSAALHATEH